MYPHDPSDTWAVCDGQDDRKCAERCYSRYFSGDSNEREVDATYWTQWVGRRMAHTRQVCDAVDVFIAPAMYLLRRFRDEFGVPEKKIVYLDYGFDLSRLQGRERVGGEPFTFGYIGTHIPAKGVDYLIKAFGALTDEGLLRIWGRDRGVETSGLKSLAEGLQGGPGTRVEWIGRIPKLGYSSTGIQPVRCNSGAIHLGRELPFGDPRGAAGGRAGHHRRLWGHGGVRAPRGEWAPLRPPRPRLR